MKGKRTGIDFSKHSLIISESKNPQVSIAELKVKGSRINSFVFVNTMGIMSVTGDYGNYIFCREFHPHDDGGVSDSYWIEKMVISSIQKPGEFCSESTQQEIEELLSRKEEQGLSEEDVEYLEDLLTHVDDEIEYAYNAYRQKPSKGVFSDNEYIPFCKKIHVQIPYVFDAFDEICRRLKEGGDINSSDDFEYNINSKDYDNDSEIR
jgi:hypothetical protein